MVFFCHNENDKRKGEMMYIITLGDNKVRSPCDLKKNCKVKTNGTVGEKIQDLGKKRCKAVFFYLREVF